MRTRKQVRKILKTSLGTVLHSINPEQGTFQIEEKVTVPIDTPMHDAKGTIKTFLKGSVVKGNLWIEVDPRVGKKRRVIMVEDEQGRYLIPAINLKPVNEYELNIQHKIKDLDDKIESWISKEKFEAPKETKTIDTSDFLDRKYGGFTGKQLLFGVIGVLLLVKIVK